MKNSFNWTYSDVSIEFKTQFVQYVNLSDEIILFLGLGPLVTYARRTSTYILEHKSWSVGTSGVLGVEWFATKAISLLAEYGASAEYYWGKETLVDNGEERKERRKGVRFRPSQAKLGLSVYF